LPSGEKIPNTLRYCATSKKWPITFRGIDIDIRVNKIDILSAFPPNYPRLCRLKDKGTHILARLGDAVEPFIIDASVQNGTNGVETGTQLVFARRGFGTLFPG
jgi:hypothetical protein